MSVTLIHGSRIVSDCETAWTASANVTASQEATTKKRGAYSAKLALTDVFTTGIIGYTSFAATNMSLATQLKFWIRSSRNITAGHINIQLDTENTFTAPLTDVSVGALTADTWAEVTVSLTTPANLTAITHLCLYMVTDQNATFNLFIDHIRLVSETKTFNELYIKGFDAPDEEDCFPDIETKKLLNGDWYETSPLVSTRNIEIGIVTSTQAEYLFLRNWYFATSTRQITYDGETLDVVRDGSNFIMDWADGFYKAKLITLRVKEKTARALNSLPSSWTN